MHGHLRRSCGGRRRSNSWGVCALGRARSIVSRTLCGCFGPSHYLPLSWSNSMEDECGSWSSRRVQSAVLGSPSGTGVPRVPRLSTRLTLNSFPLRVCVFVVHAPSRTYPRHSSGQPKIDKCVHAACLKLAARHRRKVGTITLVNFAQDDPRPCTTPV